MTRSPEVPVAAMGVTQREAARLVGVPLSTLDSWGRTGKVETRPRDLGPTVNRASALAYAAQRQRARTARDEKKAHREAHRPPIGPDWITTAEAASILGKSRPHVPHHR